jgi:(p)ppGpp synthase/HD superfamily hydrolase
MKGITRDGNIIGIITKMHTNINYADMLAEAIHIATEAHYGQMDKAKLPYIFHPLAVMQLVRKHATNYEELMILATLAVLHDVIEDHPRHRDEIYKKIPSPLIQTVLEDYLTRYPDVKYMDYIANIKTNKWATLVKLADIEHNTSEERLKHLPLKDQEYFRNKYKEAYEYLTN